MTSRDIILASTSPRRKQLLEQVGLDFRIIPSDYEEDMSLNMPPPKLAAYLAAGKAEAVAVQNPEAVVIGADTIVALGDDIFGKPKDEADAKTMLQKLQGTTNTVYTGYSIVCHARQQSYSDTVATEVVFRPMSEQEIDEYIASGEPLDKAGAYGLQGKGVLYVDRIIGDYASAIGLPVNKVWQALQEIS